MDFNAALLIFCIIATIAIFLAPVNALQKANKFFALLDRFLLPLLFAFCLLAFAFVFIIAIV